MNKRVILIALTAVMLSTVSYAQEVITENGALIIDCSKMDSKLYVSEKKKTTTSAWNTIEGTNPADDLSSDKNNAKIYPKFEVSKVVNDSGLTWREAILLCDKLTYNNSSDWRLPTQRELMLMWILKDKLVAKGFSQAYNSSYWSATEYGRDNAWNVSFSTGETRPPSKKSYFVVRCIRDI